MLFVNYYFRLRKYEIMMALNHGQYYSVSLSEERSTIQLDILLEQNAKSSAEDRRQLIDFFIDKLEQTCHEFMPASDKPVAYTPCPYCDDLHIKYKNLLEGRPSLCNMRLNYKSIPSDYYQDLFNGTLIVYIIIILCCYYVYPHRYWTVYR